MACSSSCKTQDHKTYGECMRAKNIRPRGETVVIQAKADKELSRYAEVRKQGIQPDSTRARDIERAERVSDKKGAAYRADME